MRFEPSSVALRDNAELTGAYVISAEIFGSNFLGKILPPKILTKSNKPRAFNANQSSLSKNASEVDFYLFTKQVAIMAAEQAGLTDLDGQEIDSNWDEVTTPVTGPFETYGMLTVCQPGR